MLVNRFFLVVYLLTGIAAVSGHAQNVVPDATERSVLLALYNETAGTSWTSKWTLSDIENFPATDLLGVTVSNGDIYMLNLSNRNLSGTLPDELNQLTELRYLYLSANHLEHTIPDLGSLSKLIRLDLSYNEFSGTIPSWIGSLTSLTHLNLSGKGGSNPKLSGPIPGGISALTELQELDLSYTDLSQTLAIPSEFSDLDNLKNLTMISTGLVPASIGTGLTGLASLKQLVIRSNPSFDVDQTFPDVLHDLPALQMLNIGANDFRKLPGSIRDISSLSHIILSGSSLGNADSTRLISFIDTLKTCTALRTLDISQCNIRKVPHAMMTLGNVTDLILSYNLNLEEDGCASVGQMPALLSLSLDYCGLDEVPTGLITSTTLRRLTLNGNSLDLSETTLKLIPHLTQLEIMRNSLAALPVWFGEGNMSSITYLNLSYNQLTTLQTNFALMRNMEILSISENNLMNVWWPAEFDSLKQMRKIELDNNDIDTLSNWSSWGQLQNVNLQNNELRNSVPLFLTNKESITYLNIHGNHYDNAFAPTALHATTVVAGNNDFTFTDLLKLKPSSGSFSYTPQPVVDFEREGYAYLGTLKLIAHVDTTASLNCTFKWYKYVDGINDVALFSGPANHAAKVYSYTLKESEIDSKFYYIITHPVLNALALKSKLITPVIICDVVPAQVDFSAKRYLCAMNFIPAITYPSGCRTKSYEWSFGDTSSSIEKSPFHAYGSDGTYNVTMKIRYTCGICVRDTVITKPVEYNLAEDILVDSLIVIETDLRQDILSASSATFSDAWPLQHQYLDMTKDAFSYGTEGVWRNDGAFVYDTKRKASEEVNIAVDGTFDMEYFNWEFADLEAVPDWIRATTMTEYSPYSYDLENRDVLGVYSAALYDYGGQLPSANGVNMRNREMAFTGFEALKAVTDPSDIDHRSTGNWIFSNQPLPEYYTYDVHIANKHIAVVKASLQQLSGVEKVDITSRRFFGSHDTNADRRRRSNYIAGNEIVCIQVYPANPEWSMIVLRKAPANRLWRGSIRVTNVVQELITPDIDSTFAHTGKSSLKITTEKIFPQDLLQLDSGKTYLISAWVSVHNAQPLTPTLAENLGFDVVLRDKNGVQKSAVSFAPTGRIIEGWQQVKGTFLCNGNYLNVELKFKPGSTGTAWYDDLRLHPEKGNMKSYVYDVRDYRLRAILDEENFATLYYYDAEGNLYTTKKETARGIKTLSENHSYMKQSGQ